MLPKAIRMRQSNAFREAVRGVRTGRRTLVIHANHSGELAGVQVGFVVSKAVGNAVTRNRVKRRLRQLSVPEVAKTPGGTLVVVRALPRAAAEPAQLAADFRGAWDKSMTRLAERRRGAADRARR